MRADETAATPDRVLAVSQRASVDRRDTRGFWLRLAAVGVVHVVLIVGIGSAAPRIVGEKDGSPDAISVELVDEADFRSQSTVPLPQSPPPGQPPQQQPDPQATDTSSPVQPAQPAPDPARPAERAAEPQESAAAPSPAAVPTPKEEAPELVPSLPEVPAEKAPAAKSKPAPAPKSGPPLQLAMPAVPPSPAGRAASVSRPAGITRSGENDEFGRGVIRALRQTMPPPSGQIGRVTIRLLLSENGNIVEVRLVGSAGDPMMDQSVVFAAKQASFPLAPKGASISDRTFLVTYIYR